MPKVSRLTLGGGWIAIDRNYLALNQDAFQIGKRIYGSTTFRIAKGADLFMLAHRAVGNNYAVQNRSFVTFGAGYDILTALKR